MENPIIDLRSEHLPALKQFIERQFHDRYILLNDDFFNWQYRDNPFKNKNTEYTMKIAFHGGRVFGYCGYVPVEFSMKGEGVGGRCLANLMVDKDARGFGLGARLIQSVVSDMPFAYINGYNPDTEQIYRKFGEKWVFGSGNSTLERWIGLLNKEKVENLSGERFSQDKVLFEKYGGVVKEKKISFDKSFDVFWKKVVEKKRFLNTQNRTSKYLNWRYGNHPIFKGDDGYNLFVSRDEYNEISGYLISRSEGVGGNTYRVARIIDLVTVNPDEHAKDLLSCFVKYANENNCDFVDFLVSAPNPFQQHSFKKLRFFEKTYSQIPILFNPISKKRSIHWIAYAGEKFYHDAKFTNNWYITKGDGDQDRPNIV